MKTKAAWGRILSLALILNAILIILIDLKCNSPTSPPPPSQEKPKAVKLKLLDISCTEAFINITANDTVLPVNITLNKDDAALFNFTLTKTDTTVIDTALQPGKSYIYQTIAEIKGETEESDTLQVKALELTSNNYIWQKYAFGNGASSILYDVAIIDGNNIWCVGEINVNDSSRNGFTTYNAVHWNGSEWELKKITVNFRGNNITPSLQGIFCFSKSQIWIVGGLAIYGDGNNWIPYDVRKITGYDSLSFTKCWGNNPDDMYFSGLKGSLTHYQNRQWSKIESETDFNILDIWGDKNPFTNKEEIICVLGKGLDQPGPWSDIIRINEDFSTEKLDITGLGQIYGSVWFKAGIKYYIVGDGLYEKSFKDTLKWVDLNNNRKITSYYMSCIRGNSLNDIIVVGAYGEFLHYNGSNWESLKEQTSITNGTYYRVAIKGNIVIAVGQDQNQGIILIGHHLE